MCVGDGEATWTVHHGVPGLELTTRALAVGPTGSVVYATRFMGVLDLGGGPVDSGLGQHMFLARRGDGCGFEWTTNIGGQIGAWIEEFAMAIDGAGNLVVGGSFMGTIHLQDAALEAVFGTEVINDLIDTTTDMFIARYGPDGALQWARGFGDERWQRIHDLTVQPDGTIVIAGATQGTLELGGPPIVAGDVFHGVLAAFDPTGALVWQRSYSSSFDVAVLGVDAGPAGRLATYGFAGEQTDLGGGPLPYAGDPYFLAQFEPDGAHRWGRRSIDAQHDPTHLAADPNGGVVYAGRFSQMSDRFVARLDDTGAVSWNRHFLPKKDEGDYIHLDALAVGDTVAVAGNFNGTIDFGGGVLDSPFNRELFVARYALDGSFLAADALGGPGEERPHVAAFGPDGALVVGGDFDDEIDLGAGPVVPFGPRDLMVHRFAP